MTSNTRPKSFSEALPQYDWRYCIERGLYVVLVNVYGGRFRYYPYSSSTSAEVSEELDSVMRILADPRRYETHLVLHAGRVGSEFAGLNT